MLIKISIALGALCWLYLIYQGIIGCPKYVEANSTHKTASLNCTLNTLVLFIKLLVLPVLLGAIGFFCATKNLLRILYVIFVFIPFVGLFFWYSDTISLCC
jgi:hypothetical protein